MQRAAPATPHHPRWRRRKLRRLLVSVDFWLGVAIALVAVLGLVTLVKTIAGSFAICIAGVTC